MSEEIEQSGGQASPSLDCSPSFDAAVWCDDQKDRLVRCDCSRATRMPGDGCRYCNPELGAKLKWNSEADESNQWDVLGQDEKDDLIADFIKANA